MWPMEASVSGQKPEIVVEEKTAISALMQKSMDILVR
jgi:hypothetical protein